MDIPTEEEMRRQTAEELDVDPREIVIEEESGELQAEPILENVDEVEIDSRPPWLEREDRLTRVERKLDRILELLEE